MNSSTDQKQALSEYQANLEILMRTALFSGLSIESLKLLAYLCKRETYDSGDVIFRQQEVDPNAYLIVAGKAGSILEDIGENPLNNYEENDVIGAMSLFCDMKRLFTLKADTKVTCLVLSRERFKKTLEQFPEVGSKLFEGVIRSVHQWEARFIGEHGVKCPMCREFVGVSLI